MKFSEHTRLQGLKWIWHVSLDIITTCQCKTRKLKKQYKIAREVKINNNPKKGMSDIALFENVEYHMTVFH